MYEDARCYRCRYKRACDEDRDMGLEVYCPYRNDDEEDNEENEDESEEA